MLGVVGADIAVRRLEQELLPLLLLIDEPLALVNAAGRVIISTDPTAQPGTLVGTPAAQFVCCGHPPRDRSPDLNHCKPDVFWRAVI